MFIVRQELTFFTDENTEDWPVSQAHTGRARTQTEYVSFSSTHSKVRPPDKWSGGQVYRGCIYHHKLKINYLKPQADLAEAA